MTSAESQLEEDLIEKLRGLKYDHRPDIRDRAALEANFRNHFQTLNQVKLTDAEFARLLDEIVTPDVYAAGKTLRTRNSFTRDDGTPRDKDLSNYTLVNIKDWCKNTFEAVRVLVEMLERDEGKGPGRVYDPACGSGGMFVQSKPFVPTTCSFAKT